MHLSAVRPIIETHVHELIALRRVLHSQPELSGLEFVTTEMLVERLLVEGLTPRVLAVGTGLVCDISLDPALEPDPKTMPTIALRADIDALAMADLKDTAYRSRHDGIAHACGHDVHTAAVLGAALALLELRKSAPLRGVVRLIFEPSEEVVPGGAVDVIAEGLLADVRSIYGLHCDPKLDTGTLGLRVGPLTSAADQFEITLTGPGGHTARPHLTVDLVRWAGRLADRFPETIGHLAEADVTVVFGAVHAGAAANVIPATAQLIGSFRTAARDTWVAGEQLVGEAIAEILTDPSAGTAPEWRLDYRSGVPPVDNDAITTARVRAAATGLFGAASVVDTPQSMGADSFAWYLERIPGTYVRLGTHDATTPGARPDLHSATFDVDEKAIAVGAALLAGLALAELSQLTDARSAGPDAS